MQLKLLVGLLPSLLLAQLGTMCTPTCFPAQHVVYADIRNGSDANSGMCQPHQVNGGSMSGCAVKTIAVAMPLFVTQGTGGALGLARGTCERWREQISLNTHTVASLNHLIIAGYGSGANPLLDASDIITGTDACGVSGTGTWTNDTGNTWKVSLTSPTDSLGWVNFFVNGVGPTVGGVTRATSQANCEATVNTYWPSSDTGGTFTLYYNSGSSTNLTGDGKLYEFSSRIAGLSDDGSGARYLTLQNVDARRNHSNNGSIDLAQYSTVINVSANEGTKHNLLIPDCSSINGLGMHNAWYAGQGSVMLILFDAASFGCGISVSNVTASLDVLDQSVSVYYGHFAGPGFGAIVPVTNLSGTNVTSVLDGPWTTATNISCTGCSNGITAYFDGATINGLTVNNSVAGGPAISIPQTTHLTASNVNLTCSFLNQGCIVAQTSGASLTISGTNTCENLASGGCIFVASGITMANLSVSGTTFLQPNTGGFEIYVPTIPTTASFDNNSYHYSASVGNVMWGTVFNWATPARITAWQALGFDAHSTWVNSTP